MPQCSDADLESELRAWKDLHSGQKKAKCPEPVIAKSRLMVSFLEELIEWRATGKKWLKMFKEGESANGQIQHIKR